MKKKIKPKILLSSTSSMACANFANRYASVLAKHIYIMGEIFDEVDKGVTKVEKNLIVIFLVILGVPANGRQQSS